MTPLARARSVFRTEIAALEAVAAGLDGAFPRAVDLVVAAVAARQKVIVAGVGKSGNIGRKIASTLSSTGTPAVVLNSVDALHGDLGVINDGDVVLALSYSGESEELTHLIPALKRFSTKIVAFTGAARSTLARHADVVLGCRVPREACPFNLAPTSSSTATLVMGDALALAVADARGLKLEEFALRHPSGAIGRALLVRVGDIMRRGERSAVAASKVTVKEALLLMTRAKSGSVAVVDRRGRLVGVFTDGDLRRHMAADEHLLARSLGEVMTPDPVHIRDESLAVDALRLFNQRSIDDLIVVDAKHRPVGLVDSQDLPKLKLM
ncbi:MAG: Arabinose 5-phosphate isomerase KdsD [Verrucomicrobiota bacterium]